MTAKMREKLMSLDQRADNLGRGTHHIKPGQVIIDPRTGSWFRFSYTKYLWRGPVTGKLWASEIYFRTPKYPENETHASS